MIDAPDPNAGTPRAVATPPRRSGYGKWLVIALAVVVLLYAVSPYYSFWRFTTALRSGDRRHLERAVDFDSLRKSLKQQLRSKIASSRPAQPTSGRKEGLFGGLSAEFGPRLIDTLVDAYVTPEGLAGFLANPKVPTSLTAPPPVESTAPGLAPAEPTPVTSQAETVPTTEPGFRSINWSSVRYAFFTSARDFVVDVEGTKLQFYFDDLRWQLKGVELEVGEIKL